MAGRYVLLEFDDRAKAQHFVDHDYATVGGAKVTAMFIKPSKFCDCPDKQRQHVKNWSKGKLTGLYLCLVCKRPSVHHQNGIFSRLQYVFGYNLLKGSDVE